MIHQFKKCQEDEIIIKIAGKLHQTKLQNQSDENFYMHEIMMAANNIMLTTTFDIIELDLRNYAKNDP